MPRKIVCSFRPTLLSLEDRSTPSAGALDAAFGIGGKVTTNAGFSGEGRSIVQDQLGRIIVAGYRANGSDSDFMVARYTANGSLDTSFGGTGVVTVSFGTSSFDYGYSVAIDAQNRIIVAGYTAAGSVQTVDVARLTTSGAPDLTFDADGIESFTFGRPSNNVFGIAVDSLGRIIVVGTTANDGTMNVDMAVARLTDSGALDSEFNGTGISTIDFGQGDAAFCVAIDSTNRVIIAGSTGVPNGSNFAVARLTASGVLDSSFDGDGKETIAITGSTDERAWAVAIDGLNRIVIAGDTRINSSQLDGFAVARLLTNGTLDTSFDGDGKQTINFGPSDDFGFGVAVDALNRVLVVGNYYNGSNNDFAIARLTNEGGLDPSFDGDGKQTFGFNTATGDTAYGVVIDSASRVLVAGTTTQVSSHSFALARLTGDTTTASASINDGSAQRSRLTSLTIQFSTQVSFNSSPEQAFTLARVAGGTVTFAANVEVQSGVTVVTLDHFAGSETEFGSLADGRYTLTVLASQINVAGGAFDGDNDGRPGGDLVIGSAQGLFRLFGDVNGDQTVNGFDLGFFRNAFGSQTGESNYLSYLDLNGDGIINGFDLGQFRTRFGTMLP